MTQSIDQSIEQRATNALKTLFCELNGLHITEVVSDKAKNERMEQFITDNIKRTMIEIQNNDNET